ncbi:polyphenol oxidase family protein [Arcanobacterium phocae]|uniref:polyphenol oxidase family protein n=1 Tax=Arcanobacterium phocae TaxID=131112 RepID=UPI001C0EF560|nr:polyphenol oxidase family protein [Arcanobacterium phocae]
MSPTMFDEITSNIKAGFTTVHGGVSCGSYQSANLGFHVGDYSERVACNRRRLEDYIGMPLVWMEQVHGSHIHSIGGCDPVELAVDEYGFLTVGKADGIFLEPEAVPATGLALAVMVADCVPVLIADRQEERIAAVHMGRRGMERRILAKALTMFLDRGSRVENIDVRFGPHICARCYEVSQDVYRSSIPEAQCDTRWGTRGIDMTAGGVAQAHRLGINSILVDSECTYENDLYFSHRVASKRGEQTGRFAGVISFEPHDTPTKY